MHRRSFFMLIAGSLAVALPAQAAFSDDVVAQLTQQGFQNISVSTTWLGRIRIIAYRDGGTREIVLNPRTGEILRDLWTTADGAVRGASIVDDVDSGGKGSGSGSDDDGGSDGDSGSSGGGSGSGDDQADDDQDDNSGSGSSGSGSSGSGSGKDDAEDKSGDDSNDDKDRDRSGKDN